nr:MAG TPA: hypothetical protein [Caudoviricetes sp.]
MNIKRTSDNLQVSVSQFLHIFYIQKHIVLNAILNSD